MTSVIAVHGVGNRTRERFAEESSGLADALAARDIPLHLAFWGHLAPAKAERYAAMPTDDDTNVLPVAQGFVERPAFGEAEAAHRLMDELGMRALPPDRVEEIARATMATVSVRGTTGPPPPEIEAVVRQVLDEAVERGRHLALEIELSTALAETIIATEPTGQGFVSVDLVSPLRRSLGAIVDAVDASAARVVGRSVQQVLREAQAGLTPMISTTVGDILLYEHDGASVRGVLDLEYEQARQVGTAVSLAAHSLGALVAVEWLLGAPVRRPDGSPGTAPDDREIETLVTFGTQVSLFAEIRGLQSADMMHGTTIPTVLPMRLGRWLNVWHQLDPLAFAMGRVLQLGGRAEPASVADFRLDLASVPTSTDELSFHSSYWKDARFLSWGAAVLAEAEA